LLHGDNDEKIVDVAAVMFVTEVKLDETVELVEEDVGEELAGKIADDDAAFFGLVEEAFIGGEFVPIAAMAVNTDTFHGLVVDNFVPNVFEESIEFMFIGGMAADVVFGVREFAMEELPLEAPEDAFVEEIVIEAHEIALNVKFDGEGLASVVFGSLTDVVGETFLAIKRAFADATRVGVGAETAIPPFGTDVKQEVVDDAVAERGGDDFADDGVVDDESDTAAGLIIMTDEAVTEVNDIFHGIELELMLVDG